jgi:hypothetical protein
MRKRRARMKNMVIAMKARVVEFREMKLEVILMTDGDG